jgi:hypothetical protein
MKTRFATGRAALGESQYPKPMPSSANGMLPRSSAGTSRQNRHHEGDAP